MHDSQPVLAQQYAVSSYGELAAYLEANQDDSPITRCTQRTTDVQRLLKNGWLIRCQFPETNNATEFNFQTTTVEWALT